MMDCASKKKSRAQYMRRQLPILALADKRQTAPLLGY